MAAGSLNGSSTDDSNSIDQNGKDPVGDNELDKEGAEAESTSQDTSESRTLRRRRKLEEDVKNNTQHEGEEGEDDDEDSRDPKHLRSSSPSGDITRCICGHQELETSTIPPKVDYDAGLFIQCEECFVWQHGYCVGFASEDDVPDVYYCEQCRPDYHVIVVRPSGKSTRYLPNESKKMAPPVGSPFNGTNGIDIPERTNGVRGSPRLRRSATAESNNVKEEEPVKPTNGRASSAERTSAGSRRSTQNSRDAAYEETLKRVLEESVHDANLTNTGKTGSPIPENRILRSTKSQDQGDVTEDPDRMDIDEKESAEDQTAEINSNPDDKPEQDDTMDSTRNRLASGVIEDDNANGNHDSNEPDKSTTLKADVPEVDSGSGIERTKSKSGNLTPGRNSRSRPRGNQSGSNVSNSEQEGTGVESKDEDEAKPARNGTTSKKPSSRRSRAKSKQDATKTNGTDSKYDKSIPQKAKPRIPSSFITIEEMQRRVAAILEFVARTKIDLAQEQEERRKLVEEREKRYKALYEGTSTPASDDKGFEALFESYQSSLQRMDKLYVNLRAWEKRFGKYEAPEDVGDGEESEQKQES